MRIGFLGPCLDLTRLERAADFLLVSEKASRVIYLGDDGALDRCVASWATRLVGDDPTDEGAWRRAADVALWGGPEKIDAYVDGERKRLSLRSLMSLPERVLRTVEMIGDRVAVITFDKASLDEEDIFAARLVIYGKSPSALVKAIGSRTFLTPGPLGETGGIMLLAEGDDIATVTIYDTAERSIHQAQLALPKTTKMRVQSSS